MNTEVIFAELLSVIEPGEKRDLILLFNSRDVRKLRITLIRYLRKYRRQLKHLI